jgi:hypothetical protein
MVYLEDDSCGTLKKRALPANTGAEFPQHFPQVVKATDSGIEPSQVSENERLTGFSADYLAVITLKRKRAF